MDNVYDKMILMQKYKLDTQQTILENNIKIDENLEISKVLAVSCEIDIDRPTEALSGECVVSGKLISNMVYLCSTGEMNNQTAITPFTYKVINKNISNDAKINIFARVINAEVNKLSNNQIKLLTTINYDGVVIKNNEVDYLKAGGDSTYIKQNECEVVSFVDSVCDKFEEKLEAAVKSGVKKILMTNVECMIKDYVTGMNFVSVEMELCAKLLYADKQEPSELQTITISKNIKQEVELSGLTKEMNIDIFALVINENILVDLIETDSGTNINVNVPIMVCVDGFECKKTLSVVDAYSSRSVLNIQNDEYENSVICNSEYLEAKVEGSVILTEQEPRIDKYLATTNVCANISNSYIKDGNIFVEGIISANIIYLNDEIGSIQSVQIEVPFVLERKTNIKEGTLLEPVVGVFDVDTMVKRGREIYFDARVKAFVNVTCQNNLEVVSKLETLGDYPERSDAIEIYFGKAGESFWDIAKSLKISSEIIRNQNPELTDPLDKDQNIALYFQKERKFKK